MSALARPLSVLILANQKSTSTSACKYCFKALHRNQLLLKDALINTTLYLFCFYTGVCLRLLANYNTTVGNENKNSQSILSWRLSWQVFCAVLMNAWSYGKYKFVAISFVLKAQSLSTKSAIDVFHPCTLRFKVFKFPKNVSQKVDFCHKLFIQRALRGLLPHIHVKERHNLLVEFIETIQNLSFAGPSDIVTNE